MCVSVFIRNRESGMVLLISTSLLFLFIAGVSWPQQMLPSAWRILSYFFPYTWGAHGFIHINSMGATLAQTSKEYISLWILAGGYFLLNCILLFVLGRVHDYRLAKGILEWEDVDPVSQVSEQEIHIENQE